MTVAEKLVQTLSPFEAAFFFADKARKHGGEAPLIVGLYGDPRPEKREFPALANRALMACVGFSLMRIVGMNPKSPAEFLYEYQRMHEGVEHIFPLILIHAFDSELSDVDLFAIEVMKKFPEFTAVIGPASATYADAATRSLEYRKRYAAKFEIPFTLPEFIHIAIP